MRYAFWLPVVLILLEGCVHEKQTTSEQTIASATEELLALDQAWIDAEVSRDKAALERILDEEFYATWPSGKTFDRTGFIDIILKAELAPFEVVHDLIRVHGDTALIIDLSTDGRTKYTWIAVKREGRWRVISETVSKVSAPAPGSGSS